MLRAPPLRLTAQLSPAISELHAGSYHSQESDAGASQRPGLFHPLERTTPKCPHQGQCRVLGARHQRLSRAARSPPSCASPGESEGSGRRPLSPAGSPHPSGLRKPDFPVKRIPGASDKQAHTAQVGISSLIPANTSWPAPGRTSKTHSDTH